MDKEKEYKEYDEWKEDYSMVNKTNEFLMRKSKVEQAHIKQLLDKKTPIKFIQYFIITVITCEQEMIEFGKDDNFF